MWTPQVPDGGMGAKGAEQDSGWTTVDDDFSKKSGKTGKGGRETTGPKSGKFKKDKEKEREKERNKKKSKQSGRFMFGSHNPANIFRILVEKNSRFQGNRQQDSHEALRLLVDSLREERLDQISAARKKIAREALSRWGHFEIKEWVASLKLKSGLYFLNEMEKAGRPFTAKDIVTLLQFWNGREGRAIRTAVTFPPSTDSQDRNIFKRGLQQISSGNCLYMKQWALRELGPSEGDPNVSIPVSVVDGVFKGTLISQVTCMTCKSVSVTEEPFFDLSLAIEPPPSKVKGPVRASAKKKSRRKKSGSESEGSDSDYSDSSKATPSRLSRDPCELSHCLDTFLDAEMLEGENAFGCLKCTRDFSVHGKSIAAENGAILQLQKEMEALSIDSKEEPEEDLVESKPTQPEDDMALPEAEEAISKDDSEPTELVLRRASKKYWIKDCPNVLAIHLKRFRAIKSRIEKSDKVVRFPEILDLSPYLEKPSGKVLYRLYGMSVHSGGLNSGHYIAQVKKSLKSSSGVGSQGRWFYFSDTSYHPITPESALASQPYILFYTRTNS